MVLFCEANIYTLTLSNYINVLGNQGFCCKRRGANIKSWKLSKVLPSLIRIGNSNTKYLLYSISNCVNVFRNNCSPTPGLLLESDPPSSLPLSLHFPRWPRHLWSHTIGWADIPWMDGDEYFHGFCSSKVCLEDVSWGPLVFLSKSPECRYQLLLMCAGRSGVGHPGTCGLKELSVIWAGWEPPSPRTGNTPRLSPDCQDRLQPWGVAG